MTNVPSHNRYEIIALAKDQEILYYQEFGSYQGEWILFSCNEDQYFIYKGYYGSCSGCDDYEAELSYEPTREQAIEFAKKYHHFASFDKETANHIIENDSLLSILPYNINDTYSEIKVDDVAKQLTLLMKWKEGKITPSEILEVQNLETRRKMIEELTDEKFMDGIGGEVIDTEGENKLILLHREPEDFVFVNVKDGSTLRRYMLRVPPEIRTVKQGIAWTFDLPEEEYRPIIET